MVSSLQDNFLTTGPASPKFTVILAHGAGAPMDSAFMEAMADGLAARGIRVVRFEFPYMAERRASGKKRPPDRAPVLLDHWRQVIASFPDRGRLLIGGKSMGGRMASMIADEMGVAGLVCIGYPFQPPGTSGKPRTEHLKGLVTPTLILQGTRDPFGGRDEVAGYELSPAITLHWIEDGDHDLKPRKASGRTSAETEAEAVDKIAEFTVRCVERL
jgi:predicted alpha/beta-hydrolase family hydrolase